MTDTTASPNMGMPVPNVGMAPGPNWATDLNASLSVVDSHDHSSGKGTPVTPNGLNINADLTFSNNNAYELKSVRFISQSAPISGGSDIGCIYESGVDLYYNDGNGNKIRITQSGSVAGSSGTITGLPSGTASAAYSAGTFTFQSATNTPATLSVGPVKITRNAANAKGVTVSANASQASDYAMTLPQALPAATNYVTLDNTGAVSANSSGATGSGAVVLATSATIVTANLTSCSLTDPNVSGVITGTAGGIIAASTYSPTVTAGAAGAGQAAVVNSFSYMRINNRVSVYGWLTGTTVAGSLIYNVTVPVAPSGNFSSTAQAVGVVSGINNSAPTQGWIIANTGVKTVKVTVAESGGGSHNIDTFVTFNYDCT